MVYVLSDIHGNERRFHSILKQINLQHDDMLYVLGDVIDRHPAGIRILRKIMAMPNVKMLLGNHEYMMLRALGQPYDSYADDGRALSHWYRNGGKVTHDHFKKVRKELRTEIIQCLKSLPLNIDIDVNGISYKLVHGAPVEEYTALSHYASPEQFALWKRLGEADIPPKDYTLVFGHTPTEHYQNCFPMEPWYGNNCIGIDCGGGYPEASACDSPGRLACLRLDDGFVFYSDEEK